MAKEIVRSCAKINLSLDISGVRQDGYHTVETVMQKISLFDEVSVDLIPDNGEEIVICLDSNKPFLPVDGRNIAYKAASLMAERFGNNVGGGKLKIYLNKHIPVSAGLAGGSGNGSAVMTALNRLWKIGLSTKNMCKLGADLGADAVSYTHLFQTENIVHLKWQSCNIYLFWEYADFFYKIMQKSIAYIIRKL